MRLGNLFMGAWCSQVLLFAWFFKLVAISVREKKKGTWTKCVNTPFAIFSVMSSIEKVEHYQVVKNISSYSKNGMQMAESLSTQPEVQKSRSSHKKVFAGTLVLERNKSRNPLPSFNGFRKNQISLSWFWCSIEIKEIEMDKPEITRLAYD